jgi:hypothetical protein
MQTANPYPPKHLTSALRRVLTIALPVVATAWLAAPAPCRADLITYSVDLFASPIFAGGINFEVLGTTLSGSQSLTLTPGISQSALLDVDGVNSVTLNTGSVFTGTATSNLTIDGITKSISDAFTFTDSFINHFPSFSGDAAVVFNFGTFEVTVTPISSSDTRRADFLETLLSPVPEPSSLMLLASSGLFAMLALAFRSRPRRRVPDRG